MLFGFFDAEIFLWSFKNVIVKNLNKKVSVIITVIIQILFDTDNFLKVEGTLHGKFVGSQYQVKFE